MKEIPVPISASLESKKLILPDDDDNAKQWNYQEVIGFFLYFSICSRPDISLAVIELAPFVFNQRESNWKDLKNLLKYINGIKTHALFYVMDGSNPKLIKYVDASLANFINTRR